MGKKRKIAPPSDAAYAARLKHERCLHCDAPRDLPSSPWCRACATEGKRIFLRRARTPPVVWFSDKHYVWPTRHEMIATLDTLT